MSDIVDEAREALLDHFAKVGRFARGGQHATEHVRRVDALIAAVRAECDTAERQLLDGALSMLRAESAEAKLAALREGVRPELVQWFHDGVEQCEHDYDPPPCAIDADALLRAFDVSPRLYEHKDGTFGYESHHFERLHRAALAATPAEDEEGRT